MKIIKVLTLSIALITTGCTNLKVFEGDRVSKTRNQAIKIAIANKSLIDKALENTEQKGVYVLIDTEKRVLTKLLSGMNPTDSWIKYLASEKKESTIVNEVDLPSDIAEIGVFIFNSEQIEKPFVIASSKVDELVRRELTLLNAFTDISLDLLEIKAFFVVLQKSDEAKTKNLADLNLKFTSVVKEATELAKEIEILRNAQTTSNNELRSRLVNIENEISSVEKILSSL